VLDEILDAFDVFDSAPGPILRLEQLDYSTGDKLGCVVLADATAVSSSTRPHTRPCCFSSVCC
jgi:hypothetical protein